MLLSGIGTAHWNDQCGCCQRYGRVTLEGEEEEPTSGLAFSKVYCVLGVLKVPISVAFFGLNGGPQMGLVTTAKAKAP